ncbi:proteasome-type protease [Nodosilinea sp. E11]|uniref:proteasome-type protease n=1 Tax=Nodosilinea sp. E11 TaxID=3037479 RepID=UPI0029345FFC|nr:proteasome-type protease [Nodosilinea sp. E11]WOD38242.1 proteasome-type protease [Nodosilinea sp. E11]
MTYCLGILVKDGLVIAADSRTNAGVDYISSYRKLFDFSNPGERVILLCSSGNLSITQAVVHQLNQDIKRDCEPNLHSLPTLYDVARYLGDKIRTLQEADRAWLAKDKIDFQCSFLIGGQVRGEAPELFLVYSQGNCIKATPETPFLQIGETKYGKPILDRTLGFDVPLDAVAKCALLSIDSTMRSNLSVGPPIHMVLYQTDSFEVRHRAQFQAGDPYLIKMRKHWEVALREASASMPDISWNQDGTMPPLGIADLGET